MKYYLILLIPLLGIFSCNNSGNSKKPEESAARLDSWKTELLQADKNFSAMSNDNGRGAAFINYAADDAVLLRPFAEPLIGKDSIALFFKSHPDSLTKFRWVPMRADVGGAGDIGYTYGTYTMYLWGIGTGKEHGTYCTVWKKEDGHDWKFVITTHIQGLEPDDRANYHYMNGELRKEEGNDGKHAK